MIHTFIGLTVGLIMGLTGAGGALISIPLFISLTNASLKEATVLSLFAVMLGTLVNLYGQKFQTDKKIVFGIVLFGAVANFVSLPLKALIPDIFIAILLALIGALSIASVWIKRIEQDTNTSTHHYLKIAFTGILLGVITTLTGLGGGVILVPILIRVFGKKYEEALPTSLMAIFFISLISFLLQIQMGLSLITIPDLSLIAVGVVLAFFILRIVIRRLDQAKLEILRKLIFSAVTLYSVVSVLLKSLEG
jgi:uncharacterized membrane protein YfcA